MKTHIFNYFWGVLLICLLSGCSSTIALYDQYAYKQVTSLKVDALDLMNSADQNFGDHQKDIHALDVLFRKAVEYEKHRPNNDIIIKMWSEIYDPQLNLYGGFIARWQRKDKLEPAFIEEQKEIVGLAFDQIAELQSKLQKRK